MAGHTVIVGYGTKGRSVIRTLGECGVPDGSIVVVDASAEAVAEANSSGLVGVSGDATRRSVLERAEIGTAAQIVIAVNDVLAASDPRATPLTRGDRPILVSSPDQPASQP